MKDVPNLIEKQKREKFYFKYQFHPVGQGLFASGALFSKRGEQPFFTWVYDCGSSDSPACVAREVDRLCKSLAGRNRLDVLIISHFDNDHISGIAELLKKVKVDRLFLPYLPLTQRLAHALTGQTVPPDYFQFLLDPAAYLYRVGGENLGQILYITGGEGDGPSVGQPSELPPNFAADSSSSFVKCLDDDIRLKPDDNEMNDTFGLRSSGKLGVIRDSDKLLIPGLWEFVFYNMPLPEATPAFAQSIKDSVDANVSDGTISNPEHFIGELKMLYEKQFPAGTKRNDISLVTYCGPIGVWSRRKITAPFLYPASKCCSERLFWRRNCSLCSNEEKQGALYFGDFNLKKRRLQPIVDHFHESRWGKIHVVQIPHHGATKSWHKRASAIFRHNDSVFSYGLHNTYTHPGKSVLEDLRLHHPILVTEHQGVKWLGAVERGGRWPLIRRF